MGIMDDNINNKNVDYYTTSTLDEKWKEKTIYNYENVMFVVATYYILLI